MDSTPTDTSAIHSHPRPDQDTVRRLRAQRKAAKSAAKKRRSNSAQLPLDPGVSTAHSLRPGCDLAVRVFSADADCIGIAEVDQRRNLVYLTAELLEATGFEAGQRLTFVALHHGIQLCKHIMLSHRASSLLVTLVLNECLDPLVLISPQLFTKLNGAGLVLVGLAHGGGSVELHAHPESATRAS